MNITWLLFLWISLAFSKPIITSQAIPNKQDVQAKKDKCLAIMKDESQIDIRSSRFYLPGQGYSYRIVISGFVDTEQAVALAKKLHPTLGKLNLIEDNGKNLVYSLSAEAFVAQKEKSPDSSDNQKEEQDIVVRILPAEQQEKTTQPSRPARKQQKSGDLAAVDILSKSSEMMHKATKSWTAAKTEEFRFHRTLFPSSRNSIIKAEHSFFRDVTSMRLEVKIKAGSGPDSITIVTPNGKGWVKVGGKTVERSAIRSREVLQRFSSEKILSILLGFQQDLRSSGPWRQLDSVEKLSNGWRVYQGSADNKGSIKEADFSAKNWLLKRVVVRDGKQWLEYIFADYRTFSDGKLPYHITILENGKKREEITIKKLALGKKVSPDLFQP